MRKAPQDNLVLCSSLFQNCLILTRTLYLINIPGLLFNLLKSVIFISVVFDHMRNIITDLMKRSSGIIISCLLAALLYKILFSKECLRCFRFSNIAVTYEACLAIGISGSPEASRDTQCFRKVFLAKSQDSMVSVKTVWRLVQNVFRWILFLFLQAPPTLFLSYPIDITVSGKRIWRPASNIPMSSAVISDGLEDV